MYVSSTEDLFMRVVLIAILILGTLLVLHALSYRFFATGTYLAQRIFPSVRSAGSFGIQRLDISKLASVETGVHFVSEKLERPAMTLSGTDSGRTLYFPVSSMIRYELDGTEIDSRTVAQAHISQYTILTLSHTSQTPCTQHNEQRPVST